MTYCPDLYCALCGEPWDATEVRREFTKEERTKFLQGQGCPSCRFGQEQEHLLADQVAAQEQFFGSLLDAYEE